MSQSDSREPSSRPAQDQRAQTASPAGGTPAAEMEASSKPPDEGRSRPRHGRTVVVRYGKMGQTGEFRHNLDPAPSPGTGVVVRTERGVELGRVVASVVPAPRPGGVTAEQVDGYLRRCGPDYPFRRNGKVLRLANHQDRIDQRHLDASSTEEASFAEEQIRQLELPMKLVTVEHLLGGERIVFHFSAEGRVDFRELVRRLAGQYRTRIEMHQVGARDEARLLGDYERCGRQCCCQTFLKNLRPVSMRTAKIQKATLDPSKISGRCGRLMCCLRFEQEGYDELRKKLPRRNTWVRTAEHVGRVVETHILTQLVRLALPDASHVVVANEDIEDRDVPPPKPGEPQPRKRPASAARHTKPEPPAEQPQAQEAAPQKPGEARAGEPAPASADDDAAARKRRRRRPSRKRRGGRKGPGGDKGQSRQMGGGAGSAAMAGASADGSFGRGGGSTRSGTSSGGGGSGDGTSTAGSGRSSGSKKRRRRKNRKRNKPPGRG